MTTRMSRVRVRMTVNGAEREADIDVRSNLADVLRDSFGLTGTHVGCEHGACGACTVSIDGATARACLTLAARVDGQHIVTVEGLATDGELSPVQQGCLERFSFQCGFCTPGVLMIATEMLTENPDPTESEIRAALSGNLCRCTGYDSIVAGVLRGAELMRLRSRGPD